MIGEKGTVDMAIERSSPHDNPNEGILSALTAKQRRLDGGSSSVCPTSTAIPSLTPSQCRQPEISQPTPIPPNPKGTRPTRIQLGHWKDPKSVDPEQHHAVYGCLKENGLFCFKVRDKWVASYEVEFEEHLKSLNRNVIKEYCRLRQWQLDQGEDPQQRAQNEVQAAREAQIRSSSIVISSLEAPAAAMASGICSKSVGQSRQAEHSDMHRSDVTGTKIAEQPLQRQVAKTATSLPVKRRIKKTNQLPNNKITKPNAVQRRTKRRSVRKSTTGNAPNTTIPRVTSLSNTRTLLHETQEIKRLNNVWASQEHLRSKAGAEDFKIHAGIKYERKSSGLFCGNMVSPGTIINIDGEEYVEYRVITRPQ